MFFKLDHIFEDCQRQQFHKMSHGERKGRLNVVKFLELVKSFNYFFFHKFFYSVVYVKKIKKNCLQISQCENMIFKLLI